MAASLGECSTVVVTEIGHMPSRLLGEMGVSVVETDVPVDEALASLGLRDPGYKF